LSGTDYRINVGIPPSSNKLPKIGGWPTFWSCVPAPGSAPGPFPGPALEPPLIGNDINFNV